MTEQPTKEKMIQIAKNYAKNALSARALTESQLQKRMKDRILKYCKNANLEPDIELMNEVVSSILALCQNYGMVNDTIYAEQRAVSGVLSGKSSRMTQMKMKQKGLDDATVDAAIMHYNNQAAAVIFLRKKRAGPFANSPMDDDKTKKIFASFMRQGFSYSLWNATFKLTHDEALAIIDEIN